MKSEKELSNRTKRIVVDPAVMVGKPVIKGTRVPVDAVIHRISEGATFEELMKEYPEITKKDIKAALEYAEKVIRGEDILPQIGR